MLRVALRDEILNLHLKDNAKARRLTSNGRYEKVERDSDTAVLNSQEALLQRPGLWHFDE